MISRRDRFRGALMASPSAMDTYGLGGDREVDLVIEALDKRIVAIEVS